MVKGSTMSDEQGASRSLREDAQEIGRDLEDRIVEVARRHASRAHGDVVAALFSETLQSTLGLARAFAERSMREDWTAEESDRQLACLLQVERVRAFQREEAARYETAEACARIAEACESAAPSETWDAACQGIAGTIRAAYARVVLP